MRTMYDSITAADIPANPPPELVAGYAPEDPSFAWSLGDWARFPDSLQIRIATRAWINDGMVLDVENGDATPAQAPGWATMRRADGRPFPVIYCNASTWQAVQDAFTAARVPQPLYWIAAYPGGGQVLPTLNGITAVAHQYASDATSGGHFDLSVVADYWPGVDPAPTPLGKDEGMQKTFQPGTHVQDVMDIAGATKLRLLTGWWHNVTIHKLVFIADTDYGKTDGTYDPGYNGPDWVFNYDRPGPYDIPQAPYPATMLAFEYSSDHAFDLSAH